MIESFEQIREAVFDYLAPLGHEIPPETNSEAIWLITTGGLSKEQIAQLPPELAAYQRATKEAAATLGFDSSEVGSAIGIVSAALSRILRARTYYKGPIVTMSEVRAVGEGEIKHLGAIGAMALQQVFGSNETPNA